MKILITGSRNWLDVGVIDEVLNRYNNYNPTSHTLITGCCPTGADKMAEDIASKLGWTIERHAAEWDKYGKRAGPIRNQKMVDSGADICLAFILNESKGATHCSNAAEKAGIKVTRWRVNYA